MWYTVHRRGAVRPNIHVPNTEVKSELPRAREIMVRCRATLSTCTVVSDGAAGCDRGTVYYTGALVRDALRILVFSDVGSAFLLCRVSEWKKAVLQYSIGRTRLRVCLCETKMRNHRFLTYLLVSFLERPRARACFRRRCRGFVTLNLEREDVEPSIFVS